MRVAERARERGITEILHYTTQKGVQGSIMKRCNLPRKRLEADEELAYIREEVWPRKDPCWVDHVSLSVSRINLALYNSSRKRHPNLWWAVMSFRPEILDREGVWFATTNNIYPVCRRGQGVDNFEALFQQRVPFGYYGGVHCRRANCPERWTTDRSAEVLYPGGVSLDDLQRVYVPGGHHRALVLAWCEAYDRPELEVEVDEAVFA